MNRLSLLLAICVLLCPLSLSADPPSPTVGIPVPDGSQTTQSDSASLELNPAGLGYIHGFDASYTAFVPQADFEGVIPTGHALSLGFGGESAGFGVGMHRMANPRLGPGRSSFRKYTMGGAISPSPHFSLGASINFFGSRSDERFNDLRTTNFGLQLRPSSIFGLSLVARDVRPAFFDSERALPQRLGAGVVFRAFDGRIVVDNEFHRVQGADQFQIEPRLAIEPLSGARIFGRGAFNIPTPSGDVDPTLQGISFGLELSTGTSGVQAAAQLGRHRSADFHETTGFSYRLWTGTPQKRPLFEQRGRWIGLELDESIEEQAVSRLFGQSTRAFLEIINDLDAIAADPSVDGVVVEMGRIDLGYAQLWELHQALEKVHNSGKKSIAVLTSGVPNTRTIYASSAAQEVWMQPTSPYAPTGLRVEMTSYAGLLDRIGIEAEFLRIGDYKSAPETFVLSEPSEPALEQTSKYLDTIYGELTQTIAGRRGLDPEDIAAIIDHTPLFPHEALDEGLIDRVVYADESDALLRRIAGSPNGPEDGYHQHQIADTRWGAKPEIAVVYVDGLITAGSSGQSPFGSASITGAETITKLLRKLRSDPNVKAVVVRIDSPGGSALGSDLIYRELRHLATQKPVIASMGNVAASGGYYAAAGADEIFATPLTLTGSIGIYAGKFNVDALADRLGISTHAEQRGQRAGALSLWEPWTEAEREGIATSITYLYELFIQQVARTRPLDADEVDDVARGRVWAGDAARDQQLVDHRGGLSDALRRAEQLAGLSPGQANYADRTGTAGTALSPGIATRISSLWSRLGLMDDRDVAQPTGQLGNAIDDLESALIWPMYFESDEAILMSPYQISPH